jgi:hypothetical protein
MGVADRCEFICGDILTVPLDRSFDIVAALGLFDYLADPEQVIKRVSSLTPGVFVASFPNYGFLGRLQRTIRYEWIKGCSIYHYTRDQVEGLLSPNFSSFEIIPIASGLFVAATRACSAEDICAE